VKELQNAGVTGMYIANDSGSLSAYVMGAAPTTDLENI
jgi:hypothetical protein